MRAIVSVGRGLALVALASLFSGCGGSAGAGSSAGLALLTPLQRAGTVIRDRQASGKIKHVVIIVQENRSFDNLFQGYPGADTQSFGYNSHGQKVTLSQIGLETSWDIDHSFGAFLAACDGQGKVPGTKCKMDGFDKESVGCHASCPQFPQYAFVPAAESKPDFDIAHEFVLADRMFTSNVDASSFVSHQYIIAGQASSAVNYPNGAWGCDGGPSDTISTLTQQRQYGNSIQACFDNQTLGDELDGAGLPWRFYTASLQGDGNIWSAYQAIRHIRYGPDWTQDIITPQTRFLTDIQSGSLAAVTWITPTCENSDHAGCHSNTGPQWVASLVNAVGQSQFWKSTAIFIMWDDYGGWFDHVPPVKLDYDGVGMRVPLVIVSAYAKKNYVSHVHYEHGSILKFAEDTFGLGRLAPSDTRANSPATDAFDFSKPARRFVPIQTQLNAEYFIHRPLDRRPPDTE